MNQTQMTADMSKPYLSLKEAAQFSGLSKDSLRRLARSGRVRFYQPTGARRGKILIRRDELEAAIEQSSVAAA